ncbi:MAG TPA: hypothetical protein PKY81_11825 [bacterium]|nr:hypothetical protein [bacterium]
MNENKFIIRYYNNDDWNKVSDLLVGRNFQTIKALENCWEWQIENNPYNNTVNKSRFVVEDKETNRIISFIAIFKSILIIESKEYLVNTAMHYVSDESYKGTGIPLFVKLLQENDFCLTNLTNDDRDVNKIKKLLLRNVIKMPNSYYFKFKAKFLLKKIIIKTIINSIYGSIFNFLFNNYKNESKLRVSEIKEFSKDINSIFINFNKYHKIYLKKNPDYLNWRYFNHKKFSKETTKIWGCFFEKNIVGYIVFFQFKGSIYLMELEYEPSKIEIAETLLYYFFKYASKHSVKDIHWNYAPKILSGLIRKMNFIKKEDSYYCVKTSAQFQNLDFENEFFGGFADFEDSHYLN